MRGCTTVSALARVPKHYSERGAHKRAGWTPLVYIAFLTMSKFRGMLPVGNLELEGYASKILEYSKFNSLTILWEVGDVIANRNRLTLGPFLEKRCGISEGLCPYVVELQGPVVKVLPFVCDQKSEFEGTGEDFFLDPVSQRSQTGHVQCLKIFQRSPLEVNSGPLPFAFILNRNAPLFGSTSTLWDLRKDVNCSLSRTDESGFPGIVSKGMEIVASLTLCKP